MAGDWVKMRAALLTHPKVLRISAATQSDTLRTIGGLMAVWCIFESHAPNGRLIGYTAQAIDDHLRWPGFAAQMMAVGWMADGQDGGVSYVELPGFEVHGGAASRRRAADAERKRGVRKMSAAERTKSGHDAQSVSAKCPQNVRKKSDIESAPSSQAVSAPAQASLLDDSGAEKKARRQTMRGWLETIRATGEKPIPADDEIFIYAAGTGIPEDYLRIAWLELKAQYYDSDKMYTRWRALYRRCVRNLGWGLWRYDAGKCVLTSKGQQAMRSMQSNDRSQGVQK